MCAPMERVHCSLTQISEKQLKVNYAIYSKERQDTSMVNATARLTAADILATRVSNTFQKNEQ